MQKEIEWGELSIRQQAAIELIKCDLRYLFTIMQHSQEIESNYIVSMIPYIGLIIDGVEDWITAMNNSRKNKIEAPVFSEEDRLFYAAIRQSTKFWDRSITETAKQLEANYIDSDTYFSSICRPIAKVLKLYDIFGADLVNQKHYCGNTILDSLYLPNYQISQENYGPALRDRAIISGNYVVLFGATQELLTSPRIHFSCKDYGGFIKSPVGNAYSNKFVLFSVLCHINFVLYGVNEYINSIVPTKLRFAYILYYYLCDIIQELNNLCSSSLYLDSKYYSKSFRNAMAHYKVGVFLRKDSEVIWEDPFYGITQKAFGMDYQQISSCIYKELYSISDQIENYLNL